MPRPARPRGTGSKQRRRPRARPPERLTRTRVRPRSTAVRAVRSAAKAAQRSVERMIGHWPPSHEVLRANKSGRHLAVPRHLLDATYDIFAEHGSRREESVVYWYGAESLRTGRGGKVDLVAAVGVPCGRYAEGQFTVQADDAARLGRAMMSQSLVCLAQFHTHPGSNTEHSDYDDENAISMRDGFLSLVAPCYGGAGRSLRDGVTVHEAWDRQWYVLDKGALGKRIFVIDDIVDQRQRRGGERIPAEAGRRCPPLAPRRAGAGESSREGPALGVARSLTRATSILLCKIKRVLGRA